MKAKSLVVCLYAASLARRPSKSRATRSAKPELDSWRIA